MSTSAPTACSPARRAWRTRHTSAPPPRCAGRITSASCYGFAGKRKVIEDEIVALELEAESEAGKRPFSKRPRSRTPRPLCDCAQAPTARRKRNNHQHDSPIGTPSCGNHCGLRVAALRRRPDREIDCGHRQSRAHLRDAPRRTVSYRGHRPDKDSQLAAGDQIIAVPTLVRRLPEPIKKILGDLSNEERVLVGLDVQPART